MCLPAKTGSSSAEFFAQRAYKNVSVYVCVQRFPMFFFSCIYIYIHSKWQHFAICKPFSTSKKYSFKSTLSLGWANLMQRPVHVTIFNSRFYRLFHQDSSNTCSGKNMISMRSASMMNKSHFERKPRSGTRLQQDLL